MKKSQEIVNRAVFERQECLIAIGCNPAIVLETSFKFANALHKMLRQKTKIIRDEPEREVCANCGCTTLCMMISDVWLCRKCERIGRRINDSRRNRNREQK